MISIRQQGLKDPFNVKNSRNIRNTDKHTYNCAGYALGTFSWYVVGRTKKEHHAIMRDAGRGRYSECLPLATEAICKELEGWEAVPLEDVRQKLYPPDKYEVVLLRFAFYGDDYHFIKLGRNWNWYDKRGTWPCIDRHGFNWGFEQDWYTIYFSPIIGFIRARE